MTTNVYVVRENDYEWWDIRGIFTTREVAEEYLKALIKSDPRGEFEIDEETLHASTFSKRRELRVEQVKEGRAKQKRVQEERAKRKLAQKNKPRGRANPQPVKAALRLAGVSTYGLDFQLDKTVIVCTPKRLPKATRNAINVKGVRFVFEEAIR